MVFTEKEKFVLLFIAGFAVVGIVVGLVRNVWFTDPPIDLVTPVKMNTANQTTEIEGEISDIQQSEIININIANIDELTLLPNIGPVTAERILQYRDDYGYFKSLEDLMKVKGIGPKTLEKIKSKITID